jgi:hypothetical protein
MKTPKPFVEQKKKEANDFKERMRSRASGDHKFKRLPSLNIPERKSSIHLIIGDSHSHCEEGNQRFEALGRMVKDIKPDVVIDIGDSADMSSLLMYETGSKQAIFEGFSYWKDIDAYHDAKERYHHRLKGTRKPPRHIRIIGNHEARIDRLIEFEPRFLGVLGMDDLGDEDFGWEVVPFIEPKLVDGVVYSHYFKSPGGQRPVGGAMPARAVMMKYPGSFTRVFGHTHAFGFYEDADGSPGSNMDKITSFNCGCYFDPLMSGMKWAKTDTNRWRSGILILDVGDRGQVNTWKWIDFWDVQKTWGRNK